MLAFIVICVICVTIIAVLMIIHNRQVRLLQSHLSWSYSQHDLTLDSIKNISFELMSEINTSCRCRKNQYQQIAYGLDELILARKEWIKSQWK